MAANNGDLKVLGAWASPYVMRARIALNIKSLEYEFVEEKFGTKSEFLLKSNPVHKKIPVLIHGGKPISESLVIVQYIDEAWSSSDAPQILPSDPYDRAVARFWAAYVDEKWFPSMREISASQGEEAKKAAIDKLQEGTALLEEAFNSCSHGKKFFSGDDERIGYLDIAFGCFLGWLRVTENSNSVKIIDEVKTPGLYNWAQHLSSHSAVKDVMPETDKLAEFAKLLMAKLRAGPPQN